MSAFNIYLNFPGTAEEAFTFYKSVLGGEFATIMRIKDSPGCENVPAPDLNKIMHIALPVGNGNMLMASDMVGEMGSQLKVGNNVCITVSPDTEAETHRLFDGLSVGGTVVSPLNPAFWGGLFGYFTDKFGINWMFNYMPQQP